MEQKIYREPLLNYRFLILWVTIGRKLLVLPKFNFQPYSPNGLNKANTMCFHSKQTKLALIVQSRFNATIDNPVQFKPSANINGFEYPKTLVIIDEKPNVITHYNWGLIPSWAKHEEIKKYTLNAKIETVNEKPSFKNSVDKRCLVIANGYYEWQWLDPKGKVKQKYELCLPNEELFAFAGLHSHWVNKETGEIKNTYTILTTEANPLLAEIHNYKKKCR